MGGSLKLLTLDRESLVHNAIHGNLLPILELVVSQQIFLQLFFVFSPTFFEIGDGLNCVFLEVCVLEGLLGYQVYVLGLFVDYGSLSFQVPLEKLLSSKFWDDNSTK